MTNIDRSLTIVDRSLVTAVVGESRTKLVTLPVDSTPVPMGMHGAVAAHYRVAEGTYEPHATSLDYLVGAAVACLTGTLGGRLSAIGQSIDRGELTASGEGDIVAEGKVLRVAAIHVHYRLRLTDGVEEAAVRRAHEGHHRFCPVARSIGDCIDITTELTIVGY